MYCFPRGSLRDFHPARIKCPSRFVRERFVLRWPIDCSVGAISTRYLGQYKAGALSRKTKFTRTLSTASLNYLNLRPRLAVKKSAPQLERQCKTAGDPGLGENTEALVALSLGHQTGSEPPPRNVFGTEMIRPIKYYRQGETEGVSTSKRTGNRSPYCDGERTRGVLRETCGLSEIKFSISNIRRRQSKGQTTV